MLKYITIRVGITLDIESETNKKHITDEDIAHIIHELTYEFKDTTGMAKVVDSEMLEIEYE